MAVSKKGKAQPAVLDAKILDERIKSGNIGGIYCFFGEEEYMTDYYAKKITDCAESCAIFDPDNFDIGLLRDALLSYSLGMFDIGGIRTNGNENGYKSAVIKNCGDIKFKSNEKEELIKTLSDYEIRDFACVIFKYKTLDDKNMLKFLNENAEMFEFKINTPARLVRWIKNICAAENVEISDECAEYILNRGERRMYPLRNDLDKLTAYAKAKGANAVTRDDIDELMPMKAELEAFELTNAILAKDYAKALESLKKLEHFKEEPVVVLGQISRHFCDWFLISAASGGSSDSMAVSRKTGLHEYRVKLSLNALRKYKDSAKFISAAINLCRDCDIKLKSTSIPDYNLIENLIFNIAQAAK